MNNNIREEYLYTTDACMAGTATREIKMGERNKKYIFLRQYFAELVFIAVCYLVSSIRQPHNNGQRKQKEMITIIMIINGDSIFVRL